MNVWLNLLVFCLKISIVVNTVKRVFFFVKKQNTEETKYFVPTKYKCFPKCNRVSTEKLSLEDIINFIEGFSRRGIVMNEARVEAITKKVGIDIE